MRTNLALFLLFCLFLTSCFSDRIYKKYQDVNDILWVRSDVKKFEVQVDDTLPGYDLYLGIRHTDMYFYKNLNVKIKMVTPAGIETVKDYNLGIRDNNNEFMGDGIGDIYDIELPFGRNFGLKELGKYKFEVSHNMTRDTLNMIMKVGLIIEKTQVEK